MKSLLHTSTSDVRFLFFVNCDVCHVKFIVEKKIEKMQGGQGPPPGSYVATPMHAGVSTKMFLVQHLQ